MTLHFDYFRAQLACSILLELESWDYVFSAIFSFFVLHNS